MPSRRDPRERILEAALVLFASRGYHSVSIEDILRESGCTKGTLYYHFSSKDELGFAVIDERMRRLSEEGAAAHLQSGEHPIDRLSKALDALPNVTKLGTTGSTTTDIAIRMAAVHDGFRKRLAGHLQPWVEQVEEMVCKGVADGQIADSVEPHRLAHMFVTLSAGIQYVAVLWEQETIWDDARQWLKEYLNSLRR
ncbi:MAG: TetR/AcrR family transcriptional regulator [Dehalococcoidia bacterium]|nr:TetR/AcrR family transcriptional regulator [Dehalococcoidia bacterium]